MKCEKCALHTAARQPLLKGMGCEDSARLAIFVDYPNFLEDKRGRAFVSEANELLKYLLARMGLTEKDYVLSYTLCCCPGKKLPGKKAERYKCIEACSEYRFATLQNMPNLKAIVAMGKTSSEAFTHRSEIGDTEGCDWFAMETQVRDLGIDNIWVSYSMGYLMEKAGETPSVYRVLWQAALQAELNPTETKLPPYDWKN